MAVPERLPSQARVLIAEPAELIRRGIRDVLARDRRCLVVGELATIQQVPEACLERRPDVLFLGLGTGDEDALAVLREALRLQPRLPVIVLVESHRLDDLLEPIRAGARGVLLRNAPAATLLQALADVVAGVPALDPRLGQQLFQHLASGAGLPGSQAWGASLDTAALGGLSPREQDVLRSLVQGRRNKEIAAQLGVSVGTVKTHLRHIFRKLKVADRTSAVLTALRGDLRKAA